MRADPLRIERPRHAQRAQCAAGRQRDPAACAARLDEGQVEAGVVGGDHRALEAGGELGDHLTLTRGVAQVVAGDAVHVARPEPGDRPPPWAYVAAPPRHDLAVGIDDDHGDLQQAVTSRSEPRGLDVDDGELQVIEPVGCRDRCRRGHRWQLYRATCRTVA